MLLVRADELHLRKQIEGISNKYSSYKIIFFKKYVKLIDVSLWCSFNIGVQCLISQGRISFP